LLPPIEERIANELAVTAGQVAAAVNLLDEGATVPFIARYRKEVTGGLDDTQLRNLEERLGYLRELEARRKTVIESIDSQGKLGDELRRQIESAETRTRLEDLYLPYRPKRRTKAQIAREAGLAPLASTLLADSSLDPEAAAADYIDAERGVADGRAALDGARQILMEQFAEDAALVGELREHLWEEGVVRAGVVEGKEEEGAKFADYFDFVEPVRAIPSHRAMALLRGRREGVLTLDLTLSGDDGDARVEGRIAHHFSIADRGRPADRWLLDTVRWAWKVKISTHLDLELKNRLRELAEEEAIRVFASNLNDLLLAAPAGGRAIIGLDPGIRTGVKVACVDTTGKLVETATIYPHAPRREWQQSIALLGRMAASHKVELIAIGNGTASRETDRLVADLMREQPQLALSRAVVSEAGASVYSASEQAALEFPDLDVTLRGAVSIARRLQDPLAELVKIDPRSIGVGQYQHDVNQGQLARTLDAVVEDCVNAVGVDLNTASVPLLSRVAGLNRSLAENIVRFRDEHGRFDNRKTLLKVARVGERTFEQAAGFLRIRDGENPLDASAVHPEAYPVVERILAASSRPLARLIGDGQFLRGLRASDYTDERFGVPTVTDILSELEKPGRDPRPEFVSARFREGVESISDLEPGMMLEGVVSNVANFGAFVDIGVHQDGLVHISALSNRFVRDPREIVKTGDLVKVKVVEVDVKRGRIGLTMRLDERVQPRQSRDQESREDERSQRAKSQRDRRGGSGAPRLDSAGAGGSLAGGAMAEAFARLKGGQGGTGSRQK
jgi:uncharacterized protein